MPTKEEVIPDGGLVTYYPQQRYIDKNLKGESAPLADIEALAHAQRKAEKSGALSPDVAKYMLANALVEGRFSTSPVPASVTGTNMTGLTQGVTDYGVNIGRFPAKEARDIADRMGITDKLVPPASLDKSQMAMLRAHGKNVMPGTQGDPTDIYIEPQSSSNWNAMLAATVLGIKAKQAKTPEEAIRRWNGAGPMADRHLSRVQEANRVLAHPKNAAIVELYKKALLSE